MKLNYLKCLNGSKNCGKRVKNKRDIKFLYNRAKEKALGNYVANAFPNVTTGVIQTQNGYNCSIYVEIPDDIKTVYVASGKGNSFSYHIACFYDENKTFITGSGITQVMVNEIYDSAMQCIPLTVPEGAKYIVTGSGSDGILFSVFVDGIEEKVEYEKTSNNSYTVNTIKEMKALDVAVGDIINTLGYYAASDGGEAIYDIITYEEFIDTVPPDIRYDQTGATIKVDEIGNHTLDNGLVAKLKTDGVTKPEQWGAKGDGSTNDCKAFCHMAAFTKTGKISFGQDKTYMIGMIEDTDSPSGTNTDNPYRLRMVGNLLGGQHYCKPIFGNIHDLELEGNNALIKLMTNSFGNTGMGIFNFGGNIKNLEIHHLRFDGNGRGIGYPNKNSNHTLFFSYSYLNIGYQWIKEIHPLYSQTSCKWKEGSFIGINIHDCDFYDAGAMYKKAGDSGGDFILLVPPNPCESINIENNTFTAWGRWVFAIDLGGNRERIYNVNFLNNTCLGANATDDDGNYLVADGNGSLESGSSDTWRWRALGFIDFETRKCFTNVNIIGNIINGSSGWALNGASSITRDVTVKGNTWKHTGGGYPYTIEFYSGEAENWVIEDNNFISSGGMKLGYTSKDIYIRNNQATSLGFRMFGLTGDIVFENNTRNKYAESQNYHKMLSLEGTGDAKFTGVADEDRHVNFVYKNNEFGLTGGMSYNHPWIDFDISGNTLDWVDIANFYGACRIDADQLADSNGTRNLFGCTTNTPIPSGQTNRSTPGLYFEESQVIYESAKTLGVVTGGFYLLEEYNDVEDFSKGNKPFNFNSYITNMGWDDAQMVCTRTGIIPPAGSWGFINGWSAYESYGDSFSKVQGVGSYIYTKDNAYYATDIGAGGLLGDTEPTHTSGEALCGEVTLKWLCKVGRYTLVEKVTEGI